MNGNGHQDDEQRSSNNGLLVPKVEGKLMPVTTAKCLNFKELYDGMMCVVCERIPSPYSRFLCPKGHLLCGECGEKQFGSSCNGPCPGNKMKVSISGKMAAGPVSGGVKSPVSGNCKEEIRKYPADPLYCALYLHATWFCPNAVVTTDTEGCEEVVKGDSLADHLASGVCQPPDPNLFE